MRRLLLIVIPLLALGASGLPRVIFAPAQPTVGDLITITFPTDVTRIDVAPNAQFELVKNVRNQIVVRSFRPGPFVIQGNLVRGEEKSSFQNLRILVASVLQPNDSLEPASLKPPRPLPPNRTARAAIAAAATAAALSWLAVILLARRKPEAVPQPELSPAEEFRAALGRAARLSHPDAKAIALADATRAYLARLSDAYRRELTTFELLQVLPAGEAAASIREVLTSADLAKFSPWGAGARDYRDLVERLSRLPQQLEKPGEIAA